VTCVDSSVWIDYFNGIISWQTDYLDRLLDRELVVVGDLILTEVLQGFQSDREFKQVSYLLSNLPFRNMLGRTIAIESAQHYRALRRYGVTVRKTIDVMIAAFCIHYQFSLLHSDHDFDLMEKHLKLDVIHP
jgi:predicted nucleic acid-binding protein